MDKINIQNIGNIKRNPGSVVFDDGMNEYSFLLSKSTLTKRFVIKKTSHEFKVPKLENPLEELRSLLNTGSFEHDAYPVQTIYLPLYGRDKTVFTKSGLNQWNAAGRTRDPNEVYIPIPAKIHQQFPTFFPARDVPFILRFPDGEDVTSSVCQDGRKALMSKSNKKLGKLLLRDGLKLKEGELASYHKLQLFGIDSVRIDKVDDFVYEINFAKNNSYENFKNTYI